MTIDKDRVVEFHFRETDVIELPRGTIYVRELPGAQDAPTRVVIKILKGTRLQPFGVDHQKEFTILEGSGLLRITGRPLFWYQQGNHVTVPRFAHVWFSFIETTTTLTLYGTCAMLENLRNEGGVPKKCC